MNCRTAQSLLSAYLDGEMSGSEMGRMRRHLAACGSCQREETELRLLKTLLTDVPEVEPTPDFESRLFSTVFAGQKQSREERARDSWTLLPGVAIAAAAATLMLVNYSETRHEAGHDEKSMMAAEIRRDQAAMVGNDPFTGAPLVLPTSYEGK